MIKRVMRETDENTIGAWDLDDDMLIIGYSSYFKIGSNWHKLQLVPKSQPERKYFWDDLVDASMYLDDYKSFEDCIYDKRMKYIFVLDDISEIKELKERIENDNR